MKRTLILALAAGTLLAGCGTTNRGLESVHQPVVGRTAYAFDVNAGPEGLAPGEGERLGGWLASLGLGYGDRVAIDDPAGTRGAIREDVAAEAARFGVIVSDDAPVTGAPIAPGTARVVVSRVSARVPGCPDHSRVSGIEFDGNTSSNHGCAINANLAAMVANPEDLVLGQAGTVAGYDAAVAGKAIEAYRKAPTTGASGLKAETSAGGK